MKGIFSEAICVYLRANFQVSSIILTSFRRLAGGGGGLVRTPKKPKSLEADVILAGTVPGIK